MEIALNTYSLRREFKKVGIHDSMIKLCNDLNIENVEILDSHASTNVDELKDIVKKYEDNGITTFALAPHVKLLTKPESYDDEIAKGKLWLELAQAVGAKFIRVQLSDANLQRAFQPFDDFDDEDWEMYNKQMQDGVNLTTTVANKLTEIAEKVDVKIGIETHHSYSSNYVYQEMLMKEVDSKYLGWIYDIGNFENDKMRYRSLEVIKNKVFYLHAKSYKYDENGLETQIDYPKSHDILKEAGFDGKWSIEFEGAYNGILGSMHTNELVKYCFDRSYKINTNLPTPEELLKKYS